MISHDLLILAIEARFPTLTHGNDFVVAHPIDPDTGLQGGDAFILRWMSKAFAEPTDISELLIEAEALRPTLEARNVRVHRDTLLVDSDWTQIADAPSSANRAAWATYRQALRDIPTQPGFPSDPVWPERPTAQAPPTT